MMEPESIKKHVPERIFNRGLRYYNKGHIKSYKISKEEKYYKVTAVVMGTSKYNVKIYIEILDDDFFFEGRCSCPYDWGEMCKHEVAILYKFLKEDYQRLARETRMQENYEKLIEISSLHDNRNPARLHYRVKGFIAESLANFKLIIKSDQISDYILEDLIERINNNYYSFITKNEFAGHFSGRELRLVERLKDLEMRKGRTKNSLLLPKTGENFSFLMDLIKNFRVVLDENGFEAKTGKILQPEMKVTGDKERVKFKIAADYPIYSNRREELYWTVIENVIHPLDLAGINSLPEIIEIPPEKQGEFLFEILPALESNISLDIGRRLSGYRLIKEEPEAHIKLDYQEEEICCQLQVNLAGEEYNNTQVLGLNLDENQYSEDKETPGLWYGRDNQAFARVVSFLEDYNFKVKPDNFIIRDKADIQEFITDGMIHIPEEWNVETTEAFDQIEIKQVKLEPVIELDDSEGIDWFDFRITYNLGGRTYTRRELEAMISYNKQGEPYIQIGNQYFILEKGEKEEKVNRILDLAEEQEEDRYRSPYYNMLYYRNMVEDAGINFKGNRVYDQLQRDITGTRAVTREEVPAEVVEVLRDYQKRGYFWLHFLTKYHFGGILADDMGLGKTVQILTLLKSLSLDRPALVVCPRTLIYNWQEEVDKFFPDMKCMVYYGTPEERKEMRNKFSGYDLVVTSYSIISRDFLEMGEEGLVFSYSILDEAQHIKNHKTKRAKAVKSVRSRFRLALTGTPLENSVAELWSIFDFLMPGYLGNYNNFSKKYITPINDNNDQRKIKELKDRVAPFILRRRKDEVLQELPEKIVNIQPVDMTKLQEDSYRLVLDEVKGELLQTVREKGFNRSRINVLAALTRLRQICNHPALVLGKEGQKHNSGKLDVLMELVEDAISSGHKIIVFSQFVKMLKLIRKRFDDCNIVYEYLDGSTRNRMERVNRFNNQQEIKVFLISLKAGGIGLNLTAADMVIHVDPWWNPMVERQATDRTHRLGQENRVMVYKLITRGTVEEKMLKLQRKKQDIFDNIIEDNRNPIQAITWEDIQDLLEIS